MNKRKLSLVIPFYNDSGCPIPFVNSLKEEFKKEGIEDYELILVDDCSKDNTPKELSSLKGKKIKVIINKKNKDYGGAIMTGLNEARGDILGFTCGDREIEERDIARIYKNIGDKPIIKAIRLNRKDGLSRKFISKIFNLWSKLRFGIIIPDINGYPLFFKKECYDCLDLNKIKTDWLFNLDLLRKMARKGYSIENIEIKHKKRFKGESKMIPSRIIKMVIKYLRYK